VAERLQLQERGRVIDPSAMVHPMAGLDEGVAFGARTATSHDDADGAGGRIGRARLISRPARIAERFVLAPVEPPGATTR
jgi:hypothetical protein